MRRALLSFLLLAALLGTFHAPAQAQLDQGPVSLSWEVFRLDEKAQAEAGTDTRLLAVLTVTPDPGWYTYANPDPGPNKRPVILTAKSPDSADALPAYYPSGKPKQDTFDPAVTILTYQGPFRIYLPLPPDLKPPLALSASLELVLCQDTRCAEPRLSADLAVSLDQAVAAQPAQYQPWWPEFLDALERGPGKTKTTSGPTFKPVSNETAQWIFTPKSLQSSAEIKGILSAVLLGMLAGLILNVMPCVLPVVSIKLAGMLSATGADKAARQRKIRSHSLFFALGVLLYFLFLAGLLGLTGLAWGELFQNPGSVLTITVVVFALALSMLGVFHLPVVDLKFDRKAKNPRTQALLTGLLATLLATPCSGPFLGGVLSWSLAQPPGVVAVVFLGVGLGMSAPYLGLAAFPGLARAFPRPGAWTWYVEKGVGLFLMATCIYLLNILPSSLLIHALIVLWATGVAAWLWRESGTGLSRFRPLLLKGLALALVIGSMLWALNPRSGADPWEAFDPAVFDEVLGEEILMVDFTADWCPTCKLLETTTLADAKVAKWEADFGVRAIRVDLSENFPAGEALLKALGLRSIPALAVFPAGGKANNPLILRDLFTASQVERALDQAIHNP